MIDFEKLSITELQIIIEKANIALSRKQTPDMLAEAEKRIIAFANKWELMFKRKAQIGFGQDCVGLSSGRQFVEYNPRDGNLDEIPEFFDERLCAPDDVSYYYNHNALAVLVEEDNWNDAVLQLDAWIQNILRHGEIEVVDRDRKIKGEIQMIIGDPTVKTIRFKK